MELQEYYKNLDNDQKLDFIKKICTILNTTKARVMQYILLGKPLNIYIKPAHCLEISKLTNEKVSVDKVMQIMFESSKD